MSSLLQQLANRPRAGIRTRLMSLLDWKEREKEKNGGQKSDKTFWSKEMSLKGQRLRKKQKNFRTAANGTIETPPLLFDKNRDQ